MDSYKATRTFLNNLRLAFVFTLLHNEAYISYKYPPLNLVTFVSSCTVGVVLFLGLLLALPTSQNMTCVLVGLTILFSEVKNLLHSTS